MDACDSGLSNGFENRASQGDGGSTPRASAISGGLTRRVRASLGRRTVEQSMRLVFSALRQHGALTGQAIGARSKRDGAFGMEIKTSALRQFCAGRMYAAHAREFKPRNQHASVCS
jgi:hypothetical protein